jgi:hypothetical protein
MINHYGFCFLAQWYFGSFTFEVMRSNPPGIDLSKRYCRGEWSSYLQLPPIGFFSTPLFFMFCM